MKLKINKEYLHRHLFVTLLMAALCIWFGYDAFVGYPRMSAGDLYRSIEKAEPSAGTNLEAFKRQKIQTQYGFTFLTGLAALIVGLRLGKSCKFDFSFDDKSFTANGKTYTDADIAEIDRTRWEKKGILILKLRSGTSITLDAWHHTGVKEFESSHCIES